MDLITGLYLRISTAEDLLSSIETAAQCASRAIEAAAKCGGRDERVPGAPPKGGATYQLDYAVAIGEWLHRSGGWFLNDEGISPRTMNSLATDCSVANGLGGLINPEFIHSRDFSREQDYWHGFTQEKAIAELRARIGDVRHLDAKLPDDIANFVGACWHFPGSNINSESKFPSRVDEFATSAQRAELQGTTDALAAIRKRLNACIVKFGLNTPQKPKEAPRHEEAVRACVKRLRDMYARRKDIDPFESLRVFADALVECLFREAASPWAVRYRCQWLRLDLRSEILQRHFDELGCNALAQMGRARLFDPTSRKLVIDTVAVIQRLANWSFFPDGTGDFSPNCVWGEVLSEDHKAQQTFHTYQAETWLPLRAGWNALGAVVQGALTEGNGGGGGGSGGGLLGSDAGQKAGITNGDVQTKLIAALLLHHKYDNGSCGNSEPVGCKALAKLAGVSPGSASAFFNKEFEGRENGHANYEALCERGSRGLVMELGRLERGGYSKDDFKQLLEADRVSRDD